MSLSCVNVIVENKPMTGSIEIVFTPKLDSFTYSKVTITMYRKEYNTAGLGTKIFEKDANNLSDLDFTIHDYTAKSMVEYIYSIYCDYFSNDSNNSMNSSESDSIQIASEFDGLFVGNTNKQYLIQLDCKTSYTRNTQVNYITTLSSRTPYRVSNTNTNYTTGQSSGLYLDVDNYNRLIPDYSHNLLKGLIDFLSDGTDKVLKTADGKMWYVSIDQTIEVQNNDHYLGNNNVQFNWTEIGDIPYEEMVVE